MSAGIYYHKKNCQNSGQNEVYILLTFCKHIAHQSVKAVLSSSQNYSVAWHMGSNNVHW